MIYNPILKNIEKWKNKEYIYGIRYKWWYNWSRYANLELNQKLLEQDEFDTPTTTIDFVTGEPIHEISIFSFSENLGLQIERDFKELHINFQDKFLTLEKESQKKNFLTLISEQVGAIATRVKELNIEDIYKDVLISEFKKGQESIHILLPKEINNSDAIWHFKYNCRTTIDRNENLSLLTNELVNRHLIEGSEGNVRNVKRFFKEGKVSEPIIWSGSKSELVTFFRELVNRNLVDATNHWIAVDNCFLILHNAKKYSTKGLKSEKGTQNIKRKEMIFSLIDLLEE